MKNVKPFHIVIAFLWGFATIVPLILDKINPYYVWGTRYALAPHFISIPCAALLSGFLIWMIFPKPLIKKKMIISSVTIFFETWIFGFLITFFYDYWDWHGGEGTAGLSHGELKLRQFEMAVRDMFQGFFGVILYFIILFALNMAQYKILDFISRRKHVK